MAKCCVCFFVCAVGASSLHLVLFLVLGPFAFAIENDTRGMSDELTGAVTDRLLELLLHAAEVLVQLSRSHLEPLRSFLVERTKREVLVVLLRKLSELEIIFGVSK